MNANHNRTWKKTAARVILAGAVLSGFGATGCEKEAALESAAGGSGISAYSITGNGTSHRALLERRSEIDIRLAANHNETFLSEE